MNDDQWPDNLSIKRSRSPKGESYSQDSQTGGTTRRRFVISLTLYPHQDVNNVNMSSSVSSSSWRNNIGNSVISIILNENMINEVDVASE